MEKITCKGQCPRCKSYNIDVNSIPFENLEAYKNNYVVLFPAYCKDCKKPFEVAETHVITYLYSGYGRRE